jgi:integrase
LTAIFTGLRASELRGLRWADVDLKKGQLHVRQRADRYNAIGAPKSESGERTVPLPPIVANSLRELKLTCQTAGGDIVFVSSRGHIRNHSNIVKYALIPAQIAAGVTKLMARRNIPGCMRSAISMRLGASTGRRTAA